MSRELFYEIYTIQDDSEHRRVSVLPFDVTSATLVEGHPHKVDYKKLTAPQSDLLVAALKAYLPASTVFKDDEAWDHAQKKLLE